MRKCKNCLYMGATQDGRSACVKFQRLASEDGPGCPWWISEDDPNCSVCNRPTEGKAIWYAGQIYCQQCVHKLP